MSYECEEQGHLINGSDLTWEIECSASGQWLPEQPPSCIGEGWDKVFWIFLNKFLLGSYIFFYSYDVGCMRPAMEGVWQH